MNPESSLLSSLNAPQREAVMHLDSPLLILAGAGSGKTRVITTKIAWLVAQGIFAPHEILAVTFTNKAAGEMHDRVVDMAPGAGGVMIRTFHSFGAWLLRRYSVDAGLDRYFTIYDDDDSVSLLKSLFDGLPKRELSQLSRQISRAKDYCLSPEDDLSSISFEQDFPNHYREYQRRLEEMGNADFGDLIMKAVLLLRNSDEIRRRIQSRFLVILVDEYQDSNVAQFELLKALMGRDNYLCVVGDDDQSIYRFRGAEVRNILTFADHFSGTKVIRLEQNYRSTQSVLELASHVVNANTGRLGKKLWTARKGGALPVLTALMDQDQEARYCADLLSDGNLGDTAILYRTNAQSLAFESLFTNLNIPYRIVGALRFYEREEIKDSLALLSLLVNPRDEVAFRRVINKPTKGLGPSSISKVLNSLDQTGGNLIEALRRTADSLSRRAKDGAHGFVGMFDEVAVDLESTPLPEIIRSLMEASGLLAYHQEQDDMGGTGKVRNMEELVSASADFQSGMAGLSEFLELIELDRSRFDDAEDPRGRVTLITMHNTKGLEFHRVIITGLDEGIFPSWMSEDDEDLEEERRIFYVSITRAKDELYLTTCRTRRLWGRTTRYSPSRFLSEVPPHLFARPADSLSLTSPSDVDGGDGLDVGAQVYRDEYGPGTIVKSWYNGPDSEHVVIVQFESGRTARFLPKYTPLEKISYDD